MLYPLWNPLSQWSSTGSPWAKSSPPTRLIRHMTGFQNCEDKRENNVWSHLYTSVWTIQNWDYWSNPHRLWCYLCSVGHKTNIYILYIYIFLSFQKKIWPFDYYGRHCVPWKNHSCVTFLNIFSKFSCKVKSLKKNWYSTVEYRHSIPN